MTSSVLHQLAAQAGVATRWMDAFGEAQQVGDDVLRAVLQAMALPAGSDALCRASLSELQHLSRPQGLPRLVTAWAGQAAVLPACGLKGGTTYQLRLENGGLVEGQLRSGPDGQLVVAPVAQPGYHQLEAAGLQLVLAVAPARCFSVADALRRDADQGAARMWGLAAQLYSLRRENDGGLGDFSALESLAKAAAAQGAGALAISPVHAMFSADPTRFSPYGPSSRLFLNVLHIDPARVAGPGAFDQALQAQLQLPGALSNLAHLESAERVDWPAAAAHRLALLRRLFDQFRQDNPSDQDFSAFCAHAGLPLRNHARFEALDAWLRQHRPNDPQGDWRRWPPGWRDPDSPEVEAFEQAHAEEVAFHQFLQWQADRGLEAAQACARGAGMAVGLVADLAVGADPGGSQAWGSQAAMLRGLSVGAPPDLLSRQGQGWGLGAFSPHALQAQGFTPWLDMLRANMRHCGGIRIDHVLGLKRLWVVPDGAPASEGAYLHYPMEDLLKLTALESVRHSAIVIGEDLGTVPPGFSATLAEAGLLGIRVLWFQRNGEDFLPPEAWPAEALATTSTHDLPTVAGWWTGQDISWRERLDLLGPGEPAQHRANREADKTRLWTSMVQAGCARGNELPLGPPLEEVLAFTGKTPGELVMVPLEDALGIVEQPNLPGTVEFHPNWQQRLPGDASELLEAPAVRRRLAALARARLEGSASAAGGAAA